MRNPTGSILSVKTPVNYRILREVLTSKKPFTQLEISKKSEASPAQVSRVVRWLIKLNHAERLRDARYRVSNPVGLIAAVFPYQRAMINSKIATIHPRMKKIEIIKNLIALDGILCLESALEEYSNFFRPDRICVYSEDPEKLMDAFAPYEGGLLSVVLYYPDISLEGDIEKNRRTTKYRTMIDVTCDNKLYVAKDLVMELWGMIIE